MSEYRKINKAGLDFLKEWEGFRANTYYDQAGNLTIGYGFTKAVIPELKEGDTITKEEADALLEKLIVPFEKVVDSNLRMAVDQNQFNALVSLCYNIGEAGFVTSTVLRKINQGDYPGAADAFLLWNKITVNGQKQVSQGLVNRRQAEKELFARMIALPEDGESQPRKVVMNKSSERKDKPGFKTTEFYITIGAMISPMIAKASGVDLGAEFYATIISAAAYVLSRGLTKLF